MLAVVAMGVGGVRRRGSSRRLHLHLGVLLNLRASLPSLGEDGAHHALRAAVGGAGVHAAVRVARMIRLRLRYAGGAGAGADAGGGERRPVVGRLRPLHGLLVVCVQLLPILGDADTVHPLVQSPHVVTAQVLDVLGLLLDLRVLESQAVVGGGLVLAPVVLAVVHVDVV